MKPDHIINLNIETDVLTSKCMAETVNAILEFLLFQRYQIPFPYRTYKHFVDSWDNVDDMKNNDDFSLNNYKLQRERDLALETKRSISNMRQLIFDAFEKNSIKCLRFLFGSTTFLPKEVYTIHLPSEGISSSHNYINHQLTPVNLNQMLLTLSSCEDLYEIFSNQLSSTNVYLEMELFKENEDADMNIQVTPKEISQLPTSCKDIHLNLLQKLPLNFTSSSLECCKNLKIFDESLDMAVRSFEQIESFEVTDLNFSKTWWEADILIRGYKNNTSIKGKSIWETQ